MHILLIGLSCGLAWVTRLLIRFPKNKAGDTLFLFLVPPLIIFFTFLSVICMGSSGEMFGFSASIFSYSLALVLLILSVFSFLRMFFQMRKALKRIREFPLETIADFSARVIDIDFPYSAQIGFWSPELVLSKGLIDLLTPAELTAVLAHEQAHRDYRDTFWFFGLEGIRSLTVWLPNTESLWQELLLLREIRADRQALQQVDPLTLAQSLLKVAQKVTQSNTLSQDESFCALFHPNLPKNHLVGRIESILEEKIIYSFSWSSFYSGIFLSLLPLFLVIWHSS